MDGDGWVFIFIFIFIYFFIIFYFLGGLLRRYEARYER
jgi:hypothetical protein